MFVKRKIALPCVMASLFLSHVPSYSQTTEQGATIPQSSVPEALRTARRHLYDRDVSALTLRSVEEVFETSKVRASGHANILPDQKRPADFKYIFDEQEQNAQDFIENSDTMGILILKNGKIAYEYYGFKSTPASKFQSSSMSKSITSLLTGIALEKGHIKSLDDKVGHYVPELRGSAYADVSIRNLLRMRSGVDWVDSFAVPGPAKDIQDQSIFDNVRRYTDAALSVKRKAAAGSVYHYNTLDSAVMGLVLRRATGQSVSQFTTDYLWKPAGMEADASWMLDGPEGVGYEFTGGGFNATLRDWGRLGQLILDKGRAGKNQVVGENWIAASTTCDAIPNSYMGYGYYWFCGRGPGVVMMRGGGGQYVYIDRVNQTVIVKLSRVGAATVKQRYRRPVEEHRPLDGESMAFFEAAAKWRVQ